MRHFTGTLRVIVIHELRKVQPNALLHLFSARPDLLEYGVTHYQQRSPETGTLFLQLFARYRSEASLMPDMLEEFAAEAIDNLLKSLPAEERLKGLPVEERLKGLPVEERLKGLPVEARLKGLSPKEVLAALSPEARAALARQLLEDEQERNR